MHSAELLHRDIKPSNLLLNSDCLMKVADFGLARSLREADSQQPAAVLTDYVATRWYRAPEILFGSPMYTFGVDMWSVGCIIGEMLTGKAVFPGASTLDQLQKILELTGKPTEADMKSIASPYAAKMLEQIHFAEPSESLWSERFPGAPEDAMDLMRRCLKLNPKERPSADEALAHPYVAKFHDEASERGAVRLVETVIDDNAKKATCVYRERLYHEIIKMKRKNKALAQIPAEVAG
jgi:mitogen-activated protein kinase 15